MSSAKRELRFPVSEKAGDVKDASLKSPPGMDGIVIDVKVFSRQERTDRTKKFEKAGERYTPTLQKIDAKITKEMTGAQLSLAVLVELREKALAYALFNLQERGRMFIRPGEEVYEGQVVGLHSRDNDLTVNPLKAKQLTNIRAAGKDDNVLLAAPQRMTLELGLEFIADDELLEITPRHVRIRKRYLKGFERKRASRLAS